MRLLLAGAAQSANVRSFVEAFVQSGDEVHVATLHPGPLPGATVHELARAGRGLSRAGFLLALRSFRRLHDTLRPDVTIGYYASSYGVLAACVPRPRVVVAVGGDVLREAQDSPLRRMLIPRIAGFALRRADLVLSWATHLSEAVDRLGVPAERVLMLPRGIDLTRFFPAKQPRPLPPRILSTRAIAPFYRPEVLVDAFLGLRSRGVSARLELASDGPSLEPLRARLRSSPFGADVEFPGRLEPDDLAARLRAATVYASFTPSDGVSASLLEAMASGAVPVVTDLPANRDWIRDAVNGLLVPEPVTAESVQVALLRALADTDLQTRAQSLNLRIVTDRADRLRNAARFQEAFAKICGHRGGER